MKRLLTLTLAVLMTLALFVAAGVRTVRADQDPFVGLWQITGQQEGGVYTGFAGSDAAAYLDFLPNGAVYAVLISEGEAEENYLGYKVSGPSTLVLYDDGDALPGVLDNATGVLKITEQDGSHTLLLERVKGDPLPDVYALADHAQEERKYLGYTLTEKSGGTPIDLLAMLPYAGMDPRDVYLILAPDGTGYMQFGSGNGGELTWTDTQLFDSVSFLSYTREGTHIRVDLNGQGQILEFAPEGEAEVLLTLMDTPQPEPPAPEMPKGYVGDLWGTWSKDNVEIAGWVAHSFDLDQTIENCKRFTLVYTIVKSNLAVNGKCNVFVFRPGYGWQKIGSISFSKQEVADHTPIRQEFTFDSPTTFSRVLVLPTVNMNYSCTLSLTDAYVFE